LVLWLVPSSRNRRARVVWSLVALLVIALVGTQNRGGLLAALAGGAVAAPFLEDRFRVLGRTVLVSGLALALALLLSVKVPFPGVQGREYSANQLVANVASLAGTRATGNLGGTVDGRKDLWTRVLHKQVHDGRLLAGAGFGPNLAAEVGVLDAGTDNLRSPHNSHLHVFARVGVLGMALWLLLLGAWYWRMCGACRRLRTPERRADRQLAAVCLAITTATLVSTSFDPQLEGPQGAALFWTLLGMGLAVTRRQV
jgi:O-antigen ligase